MRGDQRGRRLGYPTANIDPVEPAATPPDGVYAGWLINRGRRLGSAISIGNNPTFNGHQRTIEAYVLGLHEDLYGEWVEVDFVGLLRRMDRFDSIRQLIEAMESDIRRAREVLGL